MDRTTTPSGKRVLLIGATGMIGGHALHLCLDHDEVTTVTVIGRRSTGVSDPGLVEIEHDDLGDYRAVSDGLVHQDVALFCLGAYTGTLPDDEFRRITVDYTVAFVEALHAGSPDAVVCFLSGQGADQTEKSRMSFARYKGAAEKALLAAGFSRVHIFRPGYIYPITPRREPNLTYRIFRAIYPAVRYIYPNVGLRSDDLARAMVHAGLHGTDEHEDPVLENRAIRELARRVAQ